MAFDGYAKIARAGDLAQLVGARHKHHILRLTPGEQLHTHRGIVQHDDLIGLQWGTKVESHIGKPFHLLIPGMADLLEDIPRRTQVMYPKDIGFVLVTMGIGPGAVVAEAGTGSGALTTAFAYAVGAQGRVYSYDQREEFQRLAGENLDRLGLRGRVTFLLRDIADGSDDHGADAFFLDVPEPHEYIHLVQRALKPGGFFGCILPTTNQVSRLVRALKHYNFAFIEVCEILLRYFKTNPDRLRPADRMVAHTGFLIFARPIHEPDPDTRA